MESSSSSGSYNSSGSSYIKIVDFPVDEVTFIDTGQGEETVTYHVQNCSASSKRLRAALKKGSSEAFSLLAGKEERLLAPGLKLAVTIKFTPKGKPGSSYEGDLNLFADDYVAMSIPIVGHPPYPLLTFTPDCIDFGSQVCAHQSVSRSITLFNTGRAPGSFSISTRHLPSYLIITPLEGAISPDSQESINVDLLCRKVGTMEENIEIQLESDIISIPVTASIVQPQLELLDSESLAPTSSLHLGTTYYGTIKHKSIVIYNNSPSPVDYVAAISKESPPYGEGVDMKGTLAMACTKGGLYQHNWREQSDVPIPERLFNLSPNEGTLRPYQTERIDVTFYPMLDQSEKGWEHHQGLACRRDYALYVHITPVGLTKQGYEQNVVELGLTATALPIQISLEPSEIQFGKCLEGALNSQKMMIRNDSDSLPLTYRLSVPAHYKIDHNKGHILPEKEQSVVVIFQPKQLGDLNGYLLLEIMGEHIDGVASVFAVYKVPLMGSCIIDNQRGKRESKTQKLILDDLAASIRPHDRSVKIKSPFTKVNRHTYVDPDFAYTDSEMADIKAHQQSYRDYINDSRKERLAREKERKLGNTEYITSTDIGIEPGAGIKPPSIALRDQFTDYNETRTDSNSNSSTQSPLPPLNEETILEQCQMRLSPQQLSNIKLEPQLLKLGVVVKNFPLEKTLILTNENSQCIRLCLESKSIFIKFGSSSSSEGSCFLECVLTPYSRVNFTVTFQSDQLGDFNESIKCIINNDHIYHIPVTVSVTDASLSLSPSHITLSSPPLSTLNSLLEGQVTLHNPHHVPTGFSWGLDDHDDYVAVTHMEGVVPAHSSLVCAIFCQGNVPKECTRLSLTLNVEGGEKKKLNCSLKYWKSDCSFKETRLIFNPAPQYLPVKKTVHIVNKGTNHGYFEVLLFQPSTDCISVQPERGHVPAGDSVQLTVQLCYWEEMIFESILKVRLHEGKMLSMRINGSVEAPKVFINLDQFNFGVVYCGVKLSLPFTIHNMGQAHTVLSIDLSFYEDFTLILPDDDNPYKDTQVDLSSFKDSSNKYELTIPPSTAVKCAMDFTPRDVASYDFILPILVNGQDPVPPPLSHWPPGRTHKSQVAVDKKLPSYKNTPKRRVLATALIPPLQVLHNNIEFHIAPEMNIVSKLSEQVVSLTNVSSEPLTWGIKDKNEKRLSDGTFRFILFSKSSAPFELPLCTKTDPIPGEIGYLAPGQSFKFKALFSPGHHGHFSLSLPVYINGDRSLAYSTLEFTGDMVSGRLSVSPPHVAIQPVPLGVTVEARFIVTLEKFYGKVELSGSVPTSLPDYVSMSVQLSGPMKEENTIQIPCVLTFSSSLPISITDCVTFTEKNTKTIKSVPFSVAADNSLMTTYEFFSENLSSINFESSPPSFVPILRLPSWPFKSSSCSTLSTCSTNRPPPPPGIYPSATSSAMEYGNLFLYQSKVALCRYVSLFGWSDGIRHVKGPNGLVECVGIQSYSSNVKKKYAKALTSSRGPLLDLMRHLCGRLPPGIPLNPPPCNTRAERVDRHFKELSAILAFLEAQGALLWIVVPESLMDWNDFCYWRTSHPNTHSLLACSTHEEFNEFSEKAWTHLLAQLIKVLVIPRHSSPSANQFRQAKESNVYSSHEVMLLNWMNHHFEREGRKLYGSNIVSRTIQTFDVDLMDCIVIACLLVAYVPSLFDTDLNGLYPEPLTPEQVSHNSLLLVQAIQRIGINYDIQASDFSAPNPMMLILFCSHLFHILPHYVPSSSIKLQGSLHTCITKQITVENTSHRELLYRTLILGNASSTGCFTVKGKDDFISVPPKSSVSVPVSFKAQCLTECEGTLLLIPKGGGGRQGYPLSFKLIGQVNTVHPKSVLVHEVPLYQVTSLSVPIAIPHVTESILFHVKLVEGEKLSEKRMKLKANKMDGKAKSTVTETIICPSSLTNRSTDSIKLFHTKQTTITIGPSHNRLEQTEQENRPRIELEYIPLRKVPRDCAIILSNAQYGDTVFLVSTTVSLPLASMTLPPFLLPSTLYDKDTRTVYIRGPVGESLSEVINIPTRNEDFERAVYRLGEWDIPKDERERQHLTGSFGYASLYNAMKALNLETAIKTHRDFLPHGADEIHFDISCDNSDHFTVQGGISIPVFSRKTSSVLPIQFICHKDGCYMCHVVLTSPHDIRVFHIEVIAISKKEEPELEFKIPAFQKITQRIPLPNLSTVDWPLKATLTGQWFNGPSSLIVKASSTGYYPLNFEPRHEKTVKCRLVLVNENDMSEQSFQLIGIGERPLAQENINMHTRAKERTTMILHVPNTSDRTTLYRVETDIEFITGPSTISIVGNDVADYPIMIEPLDRGNYTGAIVFSVESRSGRIRVIDGSPLEHLWYQVNVIVDPSYPVHTYTLRANTFSESTLSVKIKNPLPEPVTLQVAIEGSSYLSGPSEILLSGETEADYTVTYAPQRLGKEKGEIIVTGLPEGEMAIEINLEATDPKPVEISPPQCELGKSAYTALTLDNPLDHEVMLAYLQTETHFIVIGIDNGTFILPPNSSSDLSIMFKPTQLGFGNQASLVFTSDEFGRQEFLVKGEGLPPSQLPQTIISTVLYQNAVAILSFTNPLSHKASFDVSMETACDQFCLFLKQTRNIVLESGVSLDIPVMFTPDYIEQCTAMILVTTAGTTEPLSWVYPVLGQPEVQPSPSLIPTLNTKAKERLQERLVVSLHNHQEDLSTVRLRPVTPGQGSQSPIEEESLREKYSYRLVLVDTDDNEEMDQLFQVSTALRLVREIISEDKIELVFDIVFLPPKPFSCKADLQVQPNSYGIWHYPVILTATEPVPDDILTLQAHHLTGEVKKGFRLTSLSEAPFPFKASLTSSSPELSIHPTSGVLPPITEKGLLFTVIYKPRTFSKDCHGRVIIETPTTYWLYEIHGQPVSYSSPTGTAQAKVDHQSPIIPQPSNKNFIRRNMQQLHAV